MTIFFSFLQFFGLSSNILQSFIQREWLSFRYLFAYVVVFMFLELRFEISRRIFSRKSNRSESCVDQPHDSKKNKDKSLNQSTNYRNDLVVLPSDFRQGTSINLDSVRAEQRDPVNQLDLMESKATPGQFFRGTRQGVERCIKSNDKLRQGVERCIKSNDKLRQEIRQENEELRQEVGRCTNSIKELRQENEELRQEVGRCTNSIKELRQENEELRQEVGRCTNSNEEHRQEVERLTFYVKLNAESSRKINFDSENVVTNSPAEPVSEPQDSCSAQPTNAHDEKTLEKHDNSKEEPSNLLREIINHFNSPISDYFRENVNLFTPLENLKTNGTPSLTETKLSEATVLLFVDGNVKRIIPNITNENFSTIIRNFGRSNNIFKIVNPPSPSVKPAYKLLEAGTVVQKDNGFEVETVGRISC
jgi:hypothetical protein